MNSSGLKSDPPVLTPPVTCGQLSHAIDERGDYNGEFVSKPHQSSCIYGVQVCRSPVKCHSIQKRKKFRRCKTMAYFFPTLRE